MKASIIYTAAIVVLCTGCFTDDVRKKMDSAIKETQEMLADQQFKTAIAHVELHKLRYGSYPDSLRQIKFLSAMDSSRFPQIEYQKLDSGYQLNYIGRYASVGGSTDITVSLHYPDEFWQGLGCVKSNAKK